MTDTPAAGGRWTLDHYKDDSFQVCEGILSPGGQCVHYLTPKATQIEVMPVSEAEKLVAAKDAEIAKERDTVDFMRECLHGISHTTLCGRNAISNPPTDWVCMRCRLEDAESEIKAMREVVEAAKSVYDAVPRDMTPTLVGTNRWGRLGIALASTRPTEKEKE